MNSLYAVPGPIGSSSFPYHGVSPWWLLDPITSPRFPTYETRGGHGSKALFVGAPSRPGLRIDCDRETIEAEPR